jgi:hypothetical protein
MKKLLIYFAVFIIAQISDATATDLRGRVDGIHGYSPAPFRMAGVQVTIFAQPNPYMGTSYTPVATAVTGSDGMYYFRNIPPGNFVLQVGGVNYPLQVFPQAAQDIQAVLLRF